MEEVREYNFDMKREGLVSSSSSVSDNSIDTAARKLLAVQGRVTGPTRRSTKGGWTEQEDEVLAFAVKKFNGKNWKKIAECIPDRTDVQCLHRWQKVLNPNLVKGPWTKEEDDLIIELVGKQGNKKWSEIARHLPGRIGKQCRERWHNHLNPAINKTPWTKEEETILIKAHNIYGNKWAEIAKFLHGRTENSIKNHWNCSVKKRLDLCSAHSSDVYSFKTKTDSRNSDLVNQSLGTTFSVDQKMDTKSSQDTCSLDLVLGNYRSPREEANVRMKPPFGTIHYKKEVAACGPTSEQWQDSAANTNASGDSHNIISNKPNKLVSASFCDLLNSSHSHERTHEPSHSINPSPLRPLPGCLQPNLNTPFDMTGGSGKYSILSHEWALSATSKRLPEPPKRPHSKLSSLQQLGISESKFSGQSDNSFSSMLKYKFNGKNKNAEASLNLEDRNYGGLCYEPLQKEDLNIFLATGRFPSTDSYIKTALSPDSSYTPPRNDRSFDNCSSPESILRSAARRFKYTPSIIRKRGLSTSRLTSHGSHSDGICTPKEQDDSSNTSTQSVRFCPRDNDDLDSVALPNAKQFFLSSKRSQKIETSAATKSIEKRLESAFDAEWDSANATLSTPAPGDSSGAEHGSNGSPDVS